MNDLENENTELKIIVGEQQILLRRLAKQLDQIHQTIQEKKVETDEKTP